MTRYNKAAGSLVGAVIAALGVFFGLEIDPEIKTQIVGAAAAFGGLIGTYISPRNRE